MEHDIDGMKDVKKHYDLAIEEKQKEYDAALNDRLNLVESKIFGTPQEKEEAREAERQNFGRKTNQNMININLI